MAASTRRNYLWRKRVSPSWVQKHLPALQDATRGAVWIIERAQRKHSVIEAFCANGRLARELNRAFGGNTQQLPRNWQSRYAKTTTKKIRIGNRLIICPPGNDKPGNGVLLIPAGAAFGTGEHVTTAMSLRILEQISRTMTQSWTLFDVGTGSGILALGARRLGARRTLGIDIDPRAIATARQNAKLNRIDRVQFRIADARTRPGRHFDVISANLFSELLIEALPILKAALRPRGMMILSGIMRDQEEAVMRALRRERLRVVRVRRRGKWIASLVELAPG